MIDEAYITKIEDRCPDPYGAYYDPESVGLFVTLRMKHGGEIRVRWNGPAPERSEKTRYQTYTVTITPKPAL